MKVQHLLDSTRLERSLKRAVARGNRFVPGIWQNAFNTQRQALPAFFPVDSRKETLQWLRHLTYSSFNFCPDTFALAVNVFDRFLCIVKVQSKHIRCIAAASLLIAAKICQEPENEPSAKEIVTLGGCKFREGDITRMERIVLNKLNWDVDASTPVKLLSILHALACSWGYLSACAISPLMHLSKVTGTLEACIMDPAFICCEPAVLALAVLGNELRQLDGCDWLDATMELQSSALISGQRLGVYYEEVQSCLVRLSRAAKAVRKPKPPGHRPAFEPRCLFDLESAAGSGATIRPLAPAAMQGGAAVSSDEDSVSDDSDESSSSDDSATSDDVSNVLRRLPPPSDLTLSAACAILSSCVPQSCGHPSSVRPVAVLSSLSPVKVV